MDADVVPAHEHSWQPVGIVEQSETSYSPVSVLDHQVRTNQCAVTSCSCGEVKRTLVSTGPWRWLNRKNPDER